MTPYLISVNRLALSLATTADPSDRIEHGELALLTPHTTHRTYIVGAAVEFPTVVVMGYGSDLPRFGPPSGRVWRGVDGRTGELIEHRVSGLISLADLQEVERASKDVARRDGVVAAQIALLAWACVGRTHLLANLLTDPTNDLAPIVADLIDGHSGTRASTVRSIARRITNELYSFPFLVDPERDWLRLLRGIPNTNKRAMDTARWP